MNRVALFGAAGAIGKSIAAAFRSQGGGYRVVGRSAESLQKTFGKDVIAELKTWDPDDPRSVRAAAEGIDTIIYLVGVNYWQFELHPILMQKTIDGAVAAGVQRMLLIGTVYPYGMPRSPLVTEDHPRNPHTFKGQMRKKQEDVLFEVHASGKIRAAELRLPDFFGPNVDKSFLWSTFQAAKVGGRAQLIGPIDKPHQFIYVPDVGPVVTRLIGEDGAWGKVWHFAGSGVTTQEETMRKIFAAAGREPRFIVANKWMLRALGLFNPLLREMVEMHYLLTNPVLLNDDRLNQLLGGLQRTSYEQGIRETLSAMPATAC
jgi:nucleoside-diphosphate-sugar epimerase